jgi:hypothetical protein
VVLEEGLVTPCEHRGSKQYEIRFQSDSLLISTLIDINCDGPALGTTSAEIHALLTGFCAVPGCHSRFLMNVGLGNLQCCLCADRALCLSF